MAHDVTLPALGESVTEGTVTRWLKAVGDTVALDEPLLEISTDKVDTEIPSPFAGTLTEIVVQEDETVAVGAVLARIGGEGEAAAPAPVAAPAAETFAAPAVEPDPAEAPAAEAPAPATPEPATPEPATARAFNPCARGRRSAAGAVGRPERRHPSRARRVRHRGDGDAVAQGRRRFRRPGRAAA